MSAPERDPGEVERVLSTWYDDVTNVRIPASTGFSNETILFDAGTQSLVARIAPSSYQVFPDDTFEMQFRVMHALAATAVPTAAVHWFEPDARWFGQPFWIMEYVDGLIPTDNPPYAAAGWLADATTEQRAQAWTSGVEAIAAVHNVRLDTLAYVPDAVDELERYERFLHWAEDGEPHALARRAISWLRTNRPPTVAPALVWGDARFSNLVYRDFEVVAVLDWEMANVGDPLLDLGWWLFADNTLTRGSGFDRLPGFESVEATSARWRTLTGRSTDALDYYLVFAGLRFTVIMIRMGKLLAGMGLVPSTFPYDNLISQGLERQLAQV